MKKLVGKKIGMTQIFLEDSSKIAVTVIQIEPNVVLEVKTKDKNKYDAIKVGYDETEPKKLNKPQLKYYEKLKLGYFRKSKELRGISGYNVGDSLKATVFSAGEMVDIQAKTKGKGYTGAIKRWNFSIGPLGHGAGYPHRYQGSISFGRGGSQGQRVPKGQRMAGRMGNETVTALNLSIYKVDEVNNLILVKGNVPGPKNSFLVIKSTSRKDATKPVLGLFLREKKASETQVVEKQEK